MTLKQIERIQTKIKKIRSALVEEKRVYGGFFDGRGLRYAPLELYLKIQDYRGALYYTRWFDKNFPNDIGSPLFLFEWTMVLFKNGKLKEAEAKASQTYFSHTDLFDLFFGRPLGSMEIPVSTDLLPYASNQPEWNDFAEWLTVFENSKGFKQFSVNYLLK